MTRLSAHLGGPKLWIKRDDATGLALGGNKTRKLEFLLADAQQQGADTIITVGAPQSNHCRQTAAAAARLGLRCELVLGKKGQCDNGNLLLDQLFQAQIHWVDGDRRQAFVAERAEQLRERGRCPYVIPLGGSNAIGTVAYALAMRELQQQLQQKQIEVDYHVVASSSGGTHAGLVVGCREGNFSDKVIGISVDCGQDAGYEQTLARLANEATPLLECSEQFSTTDFCLEYGYLGKGYGIVSDREREAIALVAQHEGILLDPVYTGKAMAGLLAMIRQGEFSPQETVLFWHTGGVPALFAYNKEVL